MSRFLLDTDTVSLIQFGHVTAVRNLSAHPDGHVALAAVSFQEQTRCWLSRLNALTAPSQLADWYDRLVTRMLPAWRRLEMLPFPQPAIQRFQLLRSLRPNVGQMDLRLPA